MIKQLEEKTILVIEDEKPLAVVIKKKLELNGFAVVTARTVKQALSYLEDLGTINAIWLDHYLLGKEDGLDFVIATKKEKSKWKKIPIYVVSNTATDDKIKSYMKLGVNKYYTKADYRLDQIVKDIKNFLQA